MTHPQVFSQKFTPIRRFLAWKTHPFWPHIPNMTQYGSAPPPHIRFGGPILWKLLHDWYQVFFDKSSVCRTLKTGLVLPIFKGKGTKANNKDNYSGISLFPTLCKIYEMVILNRLEKFARQAGYFSEMQFGFQEGSGCIEASLTILETINHAGKG